MDHQYRPPTFLLLRLNYGLKTYPKYCFTAREVKDLEKENPQETIADDLEFGRSVCGDQVCTSYTGLNSSVK